MNEEPNGDGLPENSTLLKKIWLGLLVVFYLLASFLLLLLTIKFDTMHWPPVRGFVVLVLIGSLFSAGFYIKQLISLAPRKSKLTISGKWVARFSFVFSLILILVLPTFSSYKKRAPDSDTKSNLHNMYLACKAYWMDNGSDKTCTPEIAKQPSYAYLQSVNVSVSGGGTQAAFSATGHNPKGTKSFTINSIGTITEVDKK